MKRILLSFTLLITLLLSSKLNAQCDLSLSNLTLKVNSIVGSGPYVFNFDLSFYIDNNGGNKSAYINLWKAADYTIGAGEMKWNVKNAKMPLLSEMDGPTGGYAPVGIVGIQIAGTRELPTATFVPYYSVDPGNINHTIKNLLKGTSIVATYISTIGDPNFGKTKFEIKNLELQSVTPSLSLKGNIWASQSPTANSGNQIGISCYDNQFDFTAGEVKINAGSRFNCVSPRSFQLLLNATAPIEITYKVYIDEDGNNEVNTGDIEVFSSEKINISDAVSNPTAPDYSSATISLPDPYANDPQVFRKNLIVIVSYNISNLAVQVQGRFDNACASLPVHFKSITAARNKERVAIKWETASESNNRGFNVQRNTGSEWKTIAFVFSQAEEGNSSSTLAYEYNDVNTAKGVSQYRVQQVDIDGKASFSEIRSVRGETMKKSVIAFPNPSLDGKVNIVLEDNSAKTVIVSDMSGRIVKQYKNITTNNLTIDMLQSGMYSIQVTDLSTAEVSVEKVVIKKR